MPVITLSGVTGLPHWDDGGAGLAPVQHHCPPDSRTHSTCSIDVFMGRMVVQRLRFGLQVVWTWLPPTDAASVLAVRKQFRRVTGDAFYSCSCACLLHASVSCQFVEITSYSSLSAYITRLIKCRPRAHNSALGRHTCSGNSINNSFLPRRPERRTS